MGREIRMVPKDWKHPTYINHLRGEEYRPMKSDSYADVQAGWDENKRKWDNRECPFVSAAFYTENTVEDWYGFRPNDPGDYMPDWPEEERTHLMMYETTSEGTPISPAFETPEELARWLTDNGASAYAGNPATYEQWLSTCRSGWAPSMIGGRGGLKSGVEALGDAGKSEAD